jgi:hypothetical protein
VSGRDLALLFAPNAVMLTLASPVLPARGCRRAARRGARCVASAAQPAVTVPAVVAPAPARSASASAAQLAAASLRAPQPLWSLADAEVATATAPAASDLPSGESWRYSEFIDAVQRGKVERVRFAKDGSNLQLTAVDGYAAARGAARRSSASPSPALLARLAGAPRDPLPASRSTARVRSADVRPCVHPQPPRDGGAAQRPRLGGHPGQERR